MMLLNSEKKVRGGQFQSVEMVTDTKLKPHDAT